MFRLVQVTFSLLLLTNAHRVVDTSLGDALGTDDFCDAQAVAGLCDKPAMNAQVLQSLLSSSPATFQSFLGSIGLPHAQPDLDCAELCQKTIAAVPQDCLPPSANVGCRHGLASEGADVVCDVDISAKALAESAEDKDLPEMSNDSLAMENVPMLTRSDFDYSSKALVRKVSNLFGVFPRDDCFDDDDEEPEASSLAEDVRDATPEPVDLEVGKTYKVYFEVAGGAKSNSPKDAKVTEIIQEDLEVKVTFPSGNRQRLPFHFVDAFCESPKVNEMVRARAMIDGEMKGPLSARVLENDDQGNSKLDFGRLGTVWMDQKEIWGVCRPVRQTEEPVNYLLAEEPVDLEVGQQVKVYAYQNLLHKNGKNGGTTAAEVLAVNRLDLSVSIRFPKGAEQDLPISWVVGVCRPPQPQDRMETLALTGLSPTGPYPATALENYKDGRTKVEVDKMGKTKVDWLWIKGACSPVRPVQQEKLPEDLQKSIDSAHAQAQAYVAAAIRRFNAKETEKQLALWYGTEAPFDEQVRTEILRVLNSVDRVLHKVDYFTGRKCRNTVLGYVSSTMQVGDSGRYHVYLCDIWSGQDFRVQIETLVHEASHHATGLTSDMCTNGGPGGHGMDCTVAYGRSKCKGLAEQYPQAALHNADSLCYFISDVNDENPAGQR